MIPKIIHYVWLGNNPLPAMMQQCIESWKWNMPDYNIVVWDDGRIKEIDNLFMHEAIKEKKWAFAADVIRLYAIYNHGGIYLDTDVYVYKSFDSLLNNKAFIGRESSIHIEGIKTINYLTTCCFGAEKGNKFIKKCLEYYNNRHFITSTDISLPSELRLDMRLNSEIFTILASHIGYNPSAIENTEQHFDEYLTIFPSSYFDSIGVKPDTYSTHLALGTWREQHSIEWKYSIKDKISWRFWAVINLLCRKFNRIVIKLT